MQYHEYIAQYNARRERAEQLLNRYDQKPIEQRAQNIWLHQVDKKVTIKITGNEILQIIAGLIMVGFILLLSIWV